jgi:5-formyltetrahydrofolate cyclo-ligase
MLKSKLRRIYLAKQRAFSQIERTQKSELIGENFFVNFDLHKINFLHCFLPIEKFNEIDTYTILQKVRQQFPQVQTLVPRVNFATNEIENLIFTHETELAPNLWQISEPTHNETVETEKIDAVLVPLLCFDERGYRVGYGKGFYDRFLSGCRADCLKIGLSFFPPVEKIEDAWEFDVPLDYGVTPDKVFKHKLEI